MEIKFHNLTIIGSFNIAIINPLWLKKQKIYEKEISPEFDINTGNIRYLMKEIGVYWEITPFKLMIYRSNPLEELDDSSLNFIKEIFEKLSYTPIQAIGYNIQIIPNENKNKLILQSLDLLKNKDSIFYNENSFYFSINNKFKWKDYEVLVINEIQDNQVSIRINIEKKLFNAETSKEINKFINNIKEIHNYGCSFA